MSDVARVRFADGPIIADVRVPPSKSVANRALVCAALADGTSEIRGLAPGDDTAAMLDGLERLGCGIAVHELDGVMVTDVIGTGGVFDGADRRLATRLAGTTSRFLTALAALAPGATTIDGDPPLRARPMGPLHEALLALGADVVPGEQEGHLPVTVSGPLRGADAIVMPGDISSQYVSALMMIGPYVSGGVKMWLSSDPVSRPYLDLTKSVMAAFGVVDVEVEGRRIAVAPDVYGTRTYDVEADASSDSYPLAAAAIVGGAVMVRGLGSGSQQGDWRFVDLLESMGCIVSRGTHDTTVLRRRDTPLRGIDVDMADISDLVPTIAVVATQAVTPTRITGVGFIRAKESDRLGDLASELNRAGAEVAVDDDGLTIHPRDLLTPTRFGTHHDHRLAMALALLGLVVDGVEVADPAVVSKSWPEYWEMLDQLPARHR